MLLVIASACGSVGSPPGVAAHPSATGSARSASATLTASPAPSAAETQAPNPTPPSTPPPQGIPQVTTYLAGAAFPTALAWAPDGRLFYTERAGVVRVAQGGTARLFAQVSTSTSGERGLLGLALSPNFTTDHLVYAFYSRADDLTLQRVVRWVDQAGTGAGQTTILDNLPAGVASDCCHKGGRIAFGPDGMLYVTIGDNHMADDAQNTASLRGKLLRYRPDGTVPSGNPFGNPVWAYGLRNTFGLAFSASGTLIVTDNGPSGDAGSPTTGYDKVQVVVRGGNYQWPTCYGASHPLHSPSCAGTPPTWQSGTTTLAPTGATFVSSRGPAGYRGTFVFCSWSENRMKVFSADGTTPLLDGPRGCALDVAEGPDHALYFSDSGNIYRLGS